MLKLNPAPLNPFRNPHQKSANHPHQTHGGCVCATQVALMLRSAFMHWILKRNFHGFYCSLVVLRKPSEVSPETLSKCFFLPILPIVFLLAELAVHFSSYRVSLYILLEFEPCLTSYWFKQSPCRWACWGEWQGVWGRGPAVRACSVCQGLPAWPEPCCLLVKLNAIFLSSKVKNVIYHAVKDAVGILRANESSLSRPWSRKP